MLRALYILGVACALLSACASSRDALGLRATPYGRMSVPAGSALPWESYTPASWNVTGPMCGRLERTYASNDIERFQSEFDAIALTHGGKWIGSRPSRPHVTDPSLPGYSPGSLVRVAGTSVTLDIYDLDHPEQRVPSWIDARAWRYLIHVRITDSYTNDGGGCE